ncbi:MAG: shikimate dehydrogenase [Rhizobiaceae bacterium]
MTTRAFVAGWPISHSKSPKLHGFWLDRYGIDGTYEPLALREKEFPEFLRELKSSGFAGGNVTIPHKEMAFELVDKPDEDASAIGAVNTLWFENGKLCGGNTDAYGFSANLDHRAPRWREGKNAVILGAGGAARSILYALKQARFETIHIANRTHERAKNLAEEFGAPCIAHSLDDFSRLLPDADLLINTSAIGMKDVDTGMRFDFSVLHSKAIVTDIVYTPINTPFLCTASAAGLETVDGLGMLMHQAVPGFEKWFGQRPEVTNELREYILERL